MLVIGGQVFDEPSDTHPEVQRRMTAAYRAMTPEQKWRKVASLTRTVHALALARLAASYPAEGPRQLRVRLAGELYGEELVARAVGSDG